MTDTDIDKKLLEGLRENMNDMRDQERRLYKAKGLREHIAKINVDLGDKRKREDEIKKEHESLIGKKNDAVAKMAGQMTGAMADILASVGKPVLEITDAGGLFLGVEKEDGKRVHGQALSGGERVIFDAALSFAMTAGGESFPVIIVEAAEADADRLAALINTLTNLNPDAQFIVNSWHDGGGRALGFEQNVEFVNLADENPVPDDLVVQPVEGADGES